MYVLVVNEHGISWILKKILGFARENSNWFMAYFFILNLKRSLDFRAKIDNDNFTNQKLL